MHLVSLTPPNCVFSIRVLLCDIFLQPRKNDLSFLFLRTFVSIFLLILQSDVITSLSYFRSLACLAFLASDIPYVLFYVLVSFRNAIERASSVGIAFSGISEPASGQIIWPIASRHAVHARTFPLPGYLVAREGLIKRLHYARKDGFIRLFWKRRSLVRGPE